MKSQFIYKKSALLMVMLLALLMHATAQTTYLPLNTEDNYLLDRLETLSGRLSDSLFLSTKSTARDLAVDFIVQPTTAKLSAIDLYNTRQFISENGEWLPSDSIAPGGNGVLNSKKPWFNLFYKKQYDFLYVKTNNFFLVVNPVISVQGIYENSDPGNVTKNPLISNSHGVEARGWICKRIGFYTSFNDNQEMPVSYVNNWITNTPHQAVPGADYFSGSPGHYDYLQASGYIDFAIIKDHLNLTFGSGKHFIGDGISSIFLTDFSSNMPFLRLRTHLWKFDYENLYLQLTAQYPRTGNDSQLVHKYATMHHLSYNATRWLNVGFFESTVFGQPDHFEISYLNPIILYKTVERYNGNPDKELVGFDFKALAAKHIQFYGQFALNEFKSSEFFGGRGWWGNKWGLQLGAKYFDAFAVKNFDLQAELNMVRPYTYSSHHDTIANYTNYNQPLADPLGAGFIQFIGIAKYQPVRDLYLSLKGMYYIKGSDTGSANLGNNIFQPYETLSTPYGVSMINGPKNTCVLVNLNISYQLRRNLFIDLGATHRSYSSDVYPSISTTGVMLGNSSSNYMYFGIRLNAARRDYTFF